MPDSRVDELEIDDWRTIRGGGAQQLITFVQNPVSYVNFKKSIYNLTTRTIHSQTKRQILSNGVIFIVMKKSSVEGNAFPV